MVMEFLLGVSLMLNLVNMENISKLNEGFYLETSPSDFAECRAAKNACESESGG